MKGTLSHLPWKLSKLARLKACALPGKTKLDPRAVLAAPVCVANGVPVVSGDKPRAGWKPLANERAPYPPIFFCSSWVRLSITL